MSNAFTPTTGEARPGGWGPSPESAPSVMRDDQPTLARALGLIGAALVTFGGAALIISRFRPTAVGSGWAVFALTAGIAAMLFHAAFDREVQYRRMYTYFALLALVVGAFLCPLPYPNAAGDQFGLGFLCLSLSLLFQMAVLRNEREASARWLIETACLAAGAVFAAVGLVGGTVRGEFLLPYGVLLALLGLAYLTAFVASRGIDHELAYRTGVGIGGAGTLVFLIALGRSLYPTVVQWFNKNGPIPHDYLIPSGFLLMATGALYLFVALLLASDNRYVVLIRRELGAFFYSPVAYMVLIAYTIAHGVAYGMFVGRVLGEDQALFEPIVSQMVLQWMVVIATILIVPVLTMRLLSEEHRSGTFEVLMTTPVSETAVVLSKFFAAFLMFLITWLPYGLLMIAFRVVGGTAFDFRPLLSFYIGLSLTGAAFISMGLFFSSLTSSQIGSAVLTCVGMTVLTMVFLVRFQVQRAVGPGNGWVVFLHHISYLDVWIDTLDGRLIPMYLMFHASLATLFLFLTTKVLEARKWA
jgi:ABC-type transport system involved in multi-copper enzyme maturation permease subunit